MNRLTCAWVVDECPDASGYWTIRVADGTANGNTDVAAIATVFDLNIAEHIVHVHNRNLDKDMQTDCE